MTAVMGVLLLVALLLALQVTAASLAESAPAPTEAAATQPVEGTAAVDTEALQRRVEAARKAYESELARTQDVVDLGQGSRSKVYDAHTELRETVDRLNGLRAEIERLSVEHSAHAEVLETIRKVERLVRLEQQARQLGDELDRLQRNPRLRYLVASPAGKQAVLLQVSRSMTALGAAKADANPIKLTASSLSLRRRQLRAVLELYDPSSTYVLILLKPSAFGDQHDQTRQMIASLGFETGIELIGEASWVVAPEPSPSAD